MAGRTVTIELGGKERHLKIDLNAIADIGELMNITLRPKTLMQDLMSTSLSPSALRGILWACLRHEDPDLTREQVGSWVDLDNFEEVANRFFMLFGDKSSAKVGKMVDKMLDRSPETPTSDSPSSSASPTVPSESSPISSGV